MTDDDHMHVPPRNQKNKIVAKISSLMGGLKKKKPQCSYFSEHIENN